MSKCNNMSLSGESECCLRKQQLVRELAYDKWVKAGRPEGDGTDFWLEAEEELFPMPIADLVDDDLGGGCEDGQ